MKGKDIEKYKILEIIFLLNRNDKKIQELGKKGFWRNQEFRNEKKK